MIVERQVTRKASDPGWAAEYPLADLVDGWRFRLEERSAGVYLAEGRDSAGRAVSRTGTDPEELLRSCVRDALSMKTGSRPEEPSSG